MQGVIKGLDFLRLVAETADTSLIAILKEPDPQLPFPLVTYRVKGKKFATGQVVPYFFALDRPRYILKKSYTRLPLPTFKIIADYLKGLGCAVTDDPFCWNFGVLLLLLYHYNLKTKPLNPPVPLLEVAYKATAQADHETVHLIVELIEMSRRTPFGWDTYPLLTLTYAPYDHSFKVLAGKDRDGEFRQKFLRLLRLVSERKYVTTETVPVVTPRRPVRIPFAEP
jgi:hypothetical protein